MQCMTIQKSFKISKTVKLLVFMTNKTPSDKIKHCKKYRTRKSPNTQNWFWGRLGITGLSASSLSNGPYWMSLYYR